MHTNCVKWLTIFVFLRKPADRLLRFAGCQSVRCNQCAECKLDICCVFFVQLTRQGCTGGHGWSWPAAHCCTFSTLFYPWLSPSHHSSEPVFRSCVGNVWHCFFYALTKPLSF